MFSEIFILWVMREIIGVVQTIANRGKLDYTELMIQKDQITEIKRLESEG